MSSGDSLGHLREGSDEKPKKNWILPLDHKRTAISSGGNLLGANDPSSWPEKSRNVQSFQTSGKLLYFAMFLGLTVNKPGDIPALISPEGEKEKPWMAPHHPQTEVS